MKRKLLPLAEGVRSLREELAKAIAEKPSVGVFFKVESIDLELQVVRGTDVEGGVSGGWSLLGWSISGEAGGKHTYAGTHTVKLALRPKILKQDGTVTDIEISSLTEENR